MRYEVKNKEIAVYQVENAVTASWKCAIMWSAAGHKEINSYLCCLEGDLANQFEVIRSSDMEQFIRPVATPYEEPVPMSHLIRIRKKRIYLVNIFGGFLDEVELEGELGSDIYFNAPLIKLAMLDKKTLPPISAAP